MAKSHRTSNDQRSTVKNSNSFEYRMDRLNTSKQKCQSGKSLAFNVSETDDSFLFLKDGELYFRFLI
jgi:hypothetical protein